MSTSSYLLDNTNGKNGKNGNLICDFKNVCLKENAHLKRDKRSEIYSLQLYFDNTNYNLYNIINLNMYNLLYELNQDNFEKNYSVIANLFYGEIINIIDCSKCNYNNNVFELFNTLTLNFPECEPNKNLNITELISHTLKTETIENYHCEGCKSEGCNRKNYIMRLPNYLIVHLNRFKKTDKQIEKINNLVEFPIENLDLTEYFHPSEPNNWIYSLYAVNYHSGTTQNGHYWSACHNLDDNWYIYNDENVNKFLNNGSIVTNEAYILFYYRKYIDKKN